MKVRLGFVLAPAFVALASVSTISLSCAEDVRAKFTDKRCYVEFGPPCKAWGAWSHMPDGYNLREQMKWRRLAKKEMIERARNWRNEKNMN